MNNNPDNSLRNDIRGLYDLVTEVGRQTKNPYPLSFQDFSRVMKKEENRRGLYDKLSKRAGIGGTYEDFEKAFFNPYASETNQVAALRSKTFTLDPRKEMARQRALMDASRGEYNPYGTSEVSYNPDRSQRGTEIAPIDLVDSEDTLPEIATSTGPKTTRTFWGGVVSGARGIHSGAQIAVADLLKGFGGNSDDEKEAIHLINQMEQDGTLSLERVRGLRERLLKDLDSYTNSDIRFSGDYSKKARQADALKLIEERMQRMGQDLTPEKRAVALDAMRSDLSEKGAIEDKENPFVRWKEGAKDYMRKSEVPEGTWAELGSATASVGGAIAGQAISMIPGAAPVGQAISWASIGAQTISSGGQAIMDMEDYAAEKGVYISPEDKATISIGYMAAEFGGDALGGAVASKSISAIGKLTGGRIGQKLAVRSLAKGIAGNEGVRKSLSSMSEYAQKPLAIPLAKSAGRQIVRGAVTEGPGESLTTLAQNGALDRVWKNKEDQEAWADVARQAVKDGIYGAWAGALMGGFGAGIQSVQVARMHRKEGLTLVQDEKNNLYEVIGSDQSSYLVLDRAGRQKMLPADQVVDAIHYTPQERKKLQKAYDEATEGLHPKEEVLTENQKRAGAILSATEQQQSPIYRATHPDVAEEELNNPVALAGAKKALADVLEGQNEEVRARVDQMALVLRDGDADPTEELTKLFSDESLSDNDRQSILDVVTAQSRLTAIERSHQEEMAQMQSELTKEWSAKSVVGDETARGAVISATITDADGKPKQVYVTGGVRVVTNENGTVELLPTDDGAPIYVYDESVEGDEKGHIVQMDDLSSPQLVAEDYLDLVQASLDEAETAFRSEVQAAEEQLSQEQAPQNAPEDAGDTTDDFMQSLPRTREGEVDGLRLMSERPDDFIRYLGQLYGEDFVASLPLSKSGALDLKALTPEQTLRVNEAALGKSGAVEAARQRRSKVGAERAKLEAEVKSDLGNLEKRMALRKASEEYRLYDDYVRAAEEQARQELEARRRAEEEALTPEERARREEEKRRKEQEIKDREERIRLENERRRREREELERNAEGSTVREYTEDPPRQARARGARLVNGAVVYRQEPMTVEHYADAERAFSQRPGETRIPVKRTIVEAESLQASHKEGRMNPRHFIPEAQPKDRADNGLSSTAADRIASNIRPDEITGGITAYTGAPVVNGRGEVIQGNNRTDALQTMYDGEERHAKSAELYKEYLKTHASEYGMTAEQVDAMAHPVAVDVAEVSDSEAIRLGHRGQTDLESAGADTMNAQTVGEELNSDTDPQSGQSMLVSFFNRIFNRTGANGAELSAKMDNMLNRNAEEGLKFLLENGYITDTQYKNAFETNSEGKRVVTAEAKTALKDVALYQLADVIGPRAMDIFYRLPASARNGLATFLYRDSQASFETSLAPDLGDALLVWDSLRQDPDFAGLTNFESAKIFILGKVSLFGRSELETNLGEASSLAKLLAASMQTQTEEQIAGALNKYYDLVGANETGAKTQSLIPTSQPTDTKAGAAEAVYGRVYEVPSGREKHYRFRRDVAEDFRARRDALADRITEERRKYAAAMDMARTLGVPTNPHENMSTLPDEVRAGFDETHSVKGWFYKGDNAVHIYLPANVDADDVRATFLHEAVGHYGCRELLGEVGYNQVLDGIASKLGEEEVLRAMKEYCDGSQDLADRVQVRIAMDEWIAHRAESGITKKTVWEAVKDFFRKVFGLSGKQIDQSAEMMADDLLRRSAENLQKRAERQQEVATEVSPERAEVRFRSNRSAADFARLRDAAIEQKGLVAPDLNQSSVKVTHVERHSFTGTGLQAIEKAMVWAQGRIVKDHWYHKHMSDGFKYLIDGTSIEKYLSESSTTGSDNLGVHLATLKVLPRVINRSILAETHPDYGKVNGQRSADNGVNNPNMLVHRLYGAIEIDGQLYRVKTTLHERYSADDRAYDYMVTNMELVISGSSTSDALTSSTNKHTSTERLAVAKLLKGVEKSYDPGKLLLDESATTGSEEPTIRFKRANTAFNGPSLFGETDPRGVRQGLFNADGTPRTLEGQSTVKKASLFTNDTQESTTKKSETEGSPQTQEAKQAPKKTLKPSLFGEINKVVPLVSSGQVSIGDFAQTMVEKNSYGNVNSRRESPQNRSVGGEAREEAQRAEPKRVDRSNDGNRSYDQTGGRGLLELFDNEQVEKTSSPNPKERHSSGREESSVNERQKPIQDRKREDDTGSALPVGEALHPKNQNNYRVTEGEQPTTPAARYKANINAIDLYKKLSEEGRTPTKEEQKVLASYSGWGGLGQYFNVGAYRETLIDKLGKDGFDSAAMSVNSAYYTPFPIINSLWAAARKLGFRGGKILESSAGIGNILAAIPDDVNRVSTIHAVEIDDLSGNILDMLYPDAKVDVSGFQNVSIAPGSIDLAITNVPFVSGLNVYDRENKDLSGLFRDLHDFVIAKNVRALRPGGLGVFITSSNTLDKSSTLKNWLSTSGSADVIGAFRLNNETFGGTKVTSDIIIIRKRVNGKIDPHAIDVSGTSIYKMSAGTYDSDTHTPITINTYFVNHPEFMGGEPSIGFDQGDTSYRPMAIGVYPTQSVDQDRALSSWVSSLGSIKQEPAIRQQETSADYDSTDKIQGSILIDSSGRICCSDKGLAVPLEGINENKVRGYTKQEAVRDYVELKSALDNLIRYQLENTTDEGIETFIRALNTAYDTFVGKYGYLNDNLGISFIKNNDSEFASVAALEDVTLTDKDDKNGRPIKRYEKTEIFRSRQIAGPKKYKISNLTDGIQVSLYKNGSVDVDFIAESLGMEKETTRRQLLTEELVYEDPDGGELIVSYLYQSGDIRQKIKIAEEALSRDGGERFESNLKALRAVVPPSIPAHLVPLKLGSTWAPTKLLDDYLKAKTGREATFNHAGDIWTMTKSPMSELSWQERMDIANKDADMGVRSSLVHKTVPFSELVVYALNNGRPDFSYSYKNEYGDRETVRDKEATDLARQKIEDLREDYVSWVSDYLQEKQEVAKEIEEVYNNTFNSYVTPRIPDNMLPSLFEGSANGISLYPHQKRAVLKTMNQSVMLAHEVGTGKTFTLISSAMEMRRLGIAKKPMIVVQNATIGQFASSAKKLYPAAKILALDDTDRGKSGRMRFYGKIKYADWDMVIVPQSTFELIANSPAREEAYKLKRIDEIEHVISVLEDQQSEDNLENNSISQKIRQLRRQVSDQKSDMALAKVKRMSEKSKQKKISNVSARIDKLLDKAVDEEQYFEDLGIDALLIDEAHNYKNLNFSTALGREIKGVTGTSSKKAENVQIKIETIKEKNGGRNVVMATGTPISNTASELWVFMKYLMSEADMRRLGIYYFDDFVNNFGKIQTMLEFTTSGKFKANTRFAGYDGLPELIRIWSSVSDTVLTKEVGQVNDQIPEIEMGQDQDVFLDQTPILHQYMNYVRSELEKFENMSGSEKREKSYIPLQMFGKASAAAIDVRLVINQNIDDPHSKLNKAVDELYRTYSETKSYKGTAALFCDKYQNKVSGFNVFEDIKAKLVAKGIPEDQIEIMRPGMTDKKKQAIFDKVNSGAIRIIMGTTPTLGVGVNIQRRLHTLIHLDAPQRPMDYMQRNGRILRQGNLHKDWGKTVRILRFGVKDTLDVTSYQRLKTKAAFIDSIMNGGEILNDPLSSRTIEQEEEGIFDNPVAQLSGVESAMAKMSEERKLKRLRNKKTTWGRDQVYFNNQIKLHEEDIKKTKEYIEKIKSFVSRLDDVFPDRRVHNIKIDGVSAPNVEEAMKLLRAKSKGTTKIADKLKLRPSDNPVNVDFPISLDGHKATLSLVMVSGFGQDDAGYAKVSLLKSVQFECPDLGISRNTIDGTVSIPNAFEKVINDIISGAQSERQLNALTDRVTQKEAEKKYAEERLASSRVFPEEKELQETERRVAELTKQMDEELKAKEEKYATLDSDEETIDFSETEEDGTDDEDDGYRFRSGTDDYGANNTIITRDEYINLIDRIADENASLSDVDFMSIGRQLATFHIEAGSRSFRAFIDAMVTDMGDRVRPYLKSFYNGARDLPSLYKYTGDMDWYDKVSKTDVTRVVPIAKPAVEETPGVKDIKKAKRPRKNILAAKFEQFQQEGDEYVKAFMPLYEKIKLDYYDTDRNRFTDDLDREYSIVHRNADKGLEWYSNGSEFFVRKTQNAAHNSNVSIQTKEVGEDPLYDVSRLTGIAYSSGNEIRSIRNLPIEELYDKLSKETPYARPRKNGKPVFYPYGVEVGERLLVEDPDPFPNGATPFDNKTHRMNLITIRGHSLKSMLEAGYALGAKEVSIDLVETDGSNVYYRLDFGEWKALGLTQTENPKATLAHHVMLTDPQNAVPRADVRFRRAEQSGDVSSAAEAAIDFVRNATPKNTTIDDVLRFKRVYHNSPHLLKKADGSFVDPETGERLGFDHRFMGSGEGFQAHGWGSYFSVKDLEGYGQTEQLIPYEEMPEMTIPKDDLSRYTDEQKRWAEMILDLYNDGEGDVGSTFISPLERLYSDRNAFNELYDSQEDANTRWDDFVDFYKNRIEEDVRPFHNKYVVEIPNPSGSNYLGEDAPLSEKQASAIKQTMKEKSGSEYDETFYSDFANSHPDWNTLSGGILYKTLSDYLLKEYTDSPSQAAQWTSEMLNEAGFVGIHYNGRRDGECYVIFNEKDAKITEHIRFRRTERTDPKSMTDPINPQWDGEWYSSEDLTGKSTADLLELPSAPATPEKRPTQSVAEYAETMSRHYADPRVRFRTGAHKESLRAPQPPKITDGMSLYEVAQLQHEYNRNYRDYLGSSMKRMDALVTTKGRFIRYMVDSARPVELFCKEMERMGIGMTSEQNIYQDMMTQSSRELNIRKQEVEPLVTKLTDRIRDLREQKLLDKVMDVSYTFTDEDTNETKTIKRADGYDKVSLYFQAKDIVECEQLGLVSRGREGFEKVVTEFGKSSNHITPEAYIASFEASVGKANAEALCDDMRKMSRWSIDRLHGAGLMTDDQYRSLTQSPRRYYAPQRGFKVTEESDRNAYERVEMTAEGRQSLSGDPIAYMQAIMNTTVMRVVRNQDLLHLYEWVTQHQQELARRGVLEIGETYYRKSGVDEKGNPIYMPSKQAPTIEELRHDADVRRQVAKLRMEQKRLDQSHDKGETADYVYGIKSKEISNRISDLNNSIEILYRDPTPLRGDSREQEETSRRTVKVYKDGVEQQVHFSPQYRGELVADVLNGRPSMDQDTRFYRSVGRYIEKAGAINFVSKATRFMSALMTQYNPNFAVTNALRDYGTALISNVSDFGWAYQRDFMANYAKVQKTVLKYAMSDAYSDGTYPSGKYGTYLKEFFDEGAATGWSFLPDVVKIRQTMKEMSDPSLKQKFVNGKYGVANAFGLKQGIGMLTEASELNTRFAEYVTSRERGYSSKEAAKHAKELTVNFNRKGTLAGVFGSFFGFWNASIQGTNKIVRLGKHGAEWCGTLFAGGLAQGLLYALSAPDKDDERAFTEWEMMTNLCMGDVKIPLPQGFRGFWGAGVQMALAIAGKKDWQGSVIDGMQYLVGELLPNEAAALSNIVEWDDVTGNVKLNSKKVLRDVVPTAIQPEMDVILNMDFMGNPVYREPFIKSQEGQIAQRTLGKKRTKKVYKDLSDKIWYAMGGSLERNDLMSRDETHILPDDVWLNPSVIEHVFEGRTTGVGKTLADIATCVSAASNGDPSDLRKLQIVNVLTKQEKDYSDSDRSYWKLMDFYRSRQQTMSNLRKAKEGKDLERYKEMTRRASELAPRMTGEQLTEKIWEDGTKDEKLYVTWLETKALLKQIDKGTVTKEEVAPTIDRLTEQFRELR